MKTNKKTVLAAGIALSIFLSASVSFGKEEKLAYDGTRKVSAVLSGKKMSYKMPVDSQFYQTMFNEPDYYCRTCSSVAERDSHMIDREDQKERLVSLVNWIKKKKKRPDSQARIAVSLVQKIPYDTDWYLYGDSSGRGHGTRYPYEVLYDYKGICGQKSMFIVFLLKELGFGVATFTFIGDELHQVPAIKCSPKYDFRDTGYCFIDPNYRHMITYSGSYKDSDPEVDIYADGRTFDAKNDFKDGTKFRNALNGGLKIKKNYKTYKKLVKKYGL
ncbi:MAG: hypothetical protein WC858_02810 [Parcubacteria group bacterium]|jgi:hypothetical protein